MRLAGLALPFLALLLMTPALFSAPPEKDSFGKTAKGEAVDRYTLRNKAGVVARLCTRGATLTELHVPNKQGQLADVVLGFDDVTGYEGEGNQFFGCTTGRVANRIAQERSSINVLETEWQHVASPERVQQLALADIWSNYRSRSGHRFDELGLDEQIREQLAAIDPAPPAAVTTDRKGTPFSLAVRIYCWVITSVIEARVIRAI